MVLIITVDDDEGTDVDGSQSNDDNNGGLYSSTEKVKTLSISSVKHQDRRSEFQHEDLIDVSKSFYKLVEQKDTIAQPS